MKKALVLNSGGLDSTTCLALAVKEFGNENVSTVSVFYGQKHKRELECANNIAKFYNVKHYELDLSEIFKYSNCALLTKSDVKIKHNKSYEKQIEEDGIVNTYVPFRNGLLLSVVASLALSIYPNDEVDIYLGNHADDAAENAYADCSEEFTKAMKEAIYVGSYNKVNVKAPFVNLTKAGVVKIGLSLKVPYELTYSCYEGDEISCGTCATCIDRQKAFYENGAVDPLPYKVRLKKE